MCGICAGIGKDNQILKVITGLKKLEYRGYDSSGVAFLNGDKISCIKSVGQIKNLEKKLPIDISSHIVVAHTRWATHGVVNEENSHPHFSADKKIAIVHNGIIENFEELKSQYLNNFHFYSQTDTEVFANLIAVQEGNYIEKLISASKQVKGSFAVAMICEGSDNLFLAKRNSPLYLARKEDCVMASSDICVFAGWFDDFYTLEDDEFAVANLQNISFFDKNGNVIEKQTNKIINCDFCEENLTEKYFMLKEIKEEPIVLRRTYYKYFAEATLKDEDLEQIKKYKNFHFVACGTAYHSALLGAKFLEEFCKITCKVSVASEFRYAKQKVSKKCLYVFVSQSGETADTIACAKMIKQKGAKCLCITNVPYCTLNKLADFVLPTFAGQEVAVASTKAYVAQVFTQLIFACKLSNVIAEEKLKQFVLEYQLPSLQQDFLKEILKFKKVFFIGRQKDYVTSLEGALKLKEIAYINCIGIPAGELKHGTLALVDNETLVVAISTSSELKDKIESNIQEVKARGGKILLISNLKHNVEVDFYLQLQEFDEIFMPIVSIIPLQMLCFEFATSLGYNPDKPRNLAKSVTVE